MPRYRGDPRWITTRYPATCAKCEEKIPKGQRAFYFPRERRMFCGKCGEDDAAAFSAAAWDEAHNTCL